MPSATSRGGNIGAAQHHFTNPGSYSAAVNQSHAGHLAVPGVAGSHNGPGVAGAHNGTIASGNHAGHIGNHPGQTANLGAGKTGNVVNKAPTAGGNFVHSGTQHGGLNGGQNVAGAHHAGNHHLTNSTVASGAAGQHHAGGAGRNITNVNVQNSTRVNNITNTSHHLSNQNWNNLHNNWSQNYRHHYHHNWYRGSSFAFRPWYFPFYGFGLGYGGLGFGGLGYGGFGYGGYGGLGYGGYGLGYGGYGFSPWGYNSMAYNWGYSSYYNPYCMSYSYPYNYTQPVIINYSAAPTTTVADNSADMDAARAAFKAGDYNASLDALDRAIKTSPDDPAAHEMRALTLFALGRYDEAAAGLNSLLAVAPGWNWETMSSMYPDAETYTRQLRSLEAYVRENPDNAAGNFVLAYHYLVTNYTDAARKRLQRVVELEPKDRVAAQLLKGLDDKATPPATSADAAPTDAETDLAGAWAAKQGDSQLKLTLDGDGGFTWTAPVGKEDKTFTGKYTLAGSVLVLEADSGETMVAKVTSLGSDKFHFRFVGGPGDDPGLDFERTGASVAKPSVDEPAPAPPAPPAPPAETKPEEGREF